MNNNKLVYIFRTFIIVYSIIALYYFLGKPAGGGDEALFISDLDFIKNQGWIAAVKKGISIPYMLLAYPLAQILENFMALRMVNILFFGLLFLYFFKLKKIKSIDFYLLVLFYYSTVGHFVAGINDTLFVVGLVIFISETYFILTKKLEGSFQWLFIGLIVAFFTRFIIVLFFPIVILCLYLILKRVKPNFKQIRWPILIAAVLLILNIPSLAENNTLSYDKKVPPEGVSASWPQRQYYAQLLVNDGKLSNHNHPTWKQTEAYLVENGANALPDGILDGVLFDWKLTIKEFFKDLFEIALYGSRQLGLMLPIVLTLGLWTVWKERKITGNSIIPVILMIVMAIFALVIISYVELRWLSPVFITTILYYYLKERSGEIPQMWAVLNYGLLTLISIYGCYGLILKL